MKSENDTYPKGIPYIIGNELAERFSYYGMKTILIVFMTQYLMNNTGQLDVMSEPDAKGWYHIFVSANYFFPILGSLLSDIFWGKYKTILWISLFYCAGHFALFMNDTRIGLTIGLTLIAIGAGGIKPVVSSLVGDQFPKEKKHLLEKIFGIFYVSINLGAFASALTTPLLLKKYGPGVAFAVPGILMFIATAILRIGRKKFVAIPPVGWQQYKKDVLSPEGKKAVLSLSVLFLFVAMLWCLFDQGGSAWVLQGAHMDRHVDLRFWIFQYDWLAFEILPAQMKALNPILVLVMIPVFNKWLYPGANKLFKLTPMRKMTIGMFIAALSFVITAFAEVHIQAGEHVSIMWQVWAYVALTTAEIFVSVTGLEFSYTQAPNSMKSLIMGFWLLSTSLGNLFTAFVNFFIRRADGSLVFDGANYYWFFAVAMVINAILFGLVGRRYKEESYIQPVQVGS